MALSPAPKISPTLNDPLRSLASPEAASWRLTNVCRVAAEKSRADRQRQAGAFFFLGLGQERVAVATLIRSGRLRHGAAPRSVPQTRRLGSAHHGSPAMHPDLARGRAHSRTRR